MVFFTPLADVDETAHADVVEIELPGMERKAMDVGQRVSAGDPLLELRADDHYRFAGALAALEGRSHQLRRRASCA